MSISENEANELYNKFIELRANYESTKSNSDKVKFERHKNIMAEKLKYIVYSKTTMYKKFHNYEDLNQDGYEALMMGLNSFDPSKKASIFWWLHKYIDTRIARKANSHSVVKVPIKIAKNEPPRMEMVSIFAEDTSENPEENYISKCKNIDFENRIKRLNDTDKDFVMSFLDASDGKSMKGFCSENNIKSAQLKTKIKKLIKKMK